MACSGMYRLPPILDSAALTVTLPTCMYKLPPVNSGSHPPQLQAGGGAAAAELAQLERRQEAILARLAQLRAQVEEATQRHGGGATRSTTTRANPPPQHAGDIVVVASAARPPLSLLLLRRLAPAVSLTSHVHSTSAAVPAELSRAFTWRGTAGAAHVRVIWKPVDGEPRLLVSPAGQGVPLLGEQQVFRYVSRALLPDQYEAGDATRAARIDLLLEHAGRLADGSGKEKQAALRALNGLLGGQEYLLGVRLALLDGVLWSALRTAALQSPPNVTAWSDRVAAAAGLDNEPSAAATTKTRTDKPAPKTSNDANTAKVTPARPASAAGAAIKPSSPPPAASTSAASAGGHLDQAGLMAFFSTFDIASETIPHPAVFTVQEMLPYLTSISGAITKNLFLRDKKKTLYLLTARHDLEFRLADVARQLPGAKELRFGDEEVLFAKLGVRQGCVTPLAVVNDKERAVRLLVDAKLLDGTFEKLWFHPLTNEATTGLSADDFRRFAVETGHEPTLVNV